VSVSTDIEANGIYIVGAGAQTPVGRNYRAAAAAVRCGISAYAEHPFMIDRHGEPMIVARADWLDPRMPAAERVEKLAVDAAREALPKTLPDDVTIGLHLAISSDLFRERRTRRITTGNFLAALSNPTLSEPKVFADAHAAGMLALESAVADIRSGQLDFCLVGGVDSYVDPERLESVDFAGRLHSVNNSWGFTPGECAAFVLLASGQAVVSCGLGPLSQVCAVATATEPHPAGTDTVCIGEGLTEAFRAVLDASTPVSDTYCDLNGETYRADELGFAVCRLSAFFENAGQFTAPADCCGDVGAASVLLNLILSQSAWVGGYACGDCALVWSSSAWLPTRGATRLKSMIPSET